MTQVLSVIDQTTTKGSSKGPYLFYVASSSTAWLNGNTPPSTGSLVTAASTITVQPAPTGVTEVAIKEGTLTNFKILTLITTNVVTNVVTLVSITPSAKPFTGLAPHGWNGSLPNVHQIATQIDKKIATVTTISAAPTGSSKYLIKRQHAEWITATVNGMIVSWVNNYTPVGLHAVSTIGTDGANSSTIVTIEVVTG